jgi:hypothetical protein
MAALQVSVDDLQSKHKVLSRLLFCFYGRITV